MSLTEKYNDAISSEKKSAENEAQCLAKLKKYEKCMLGKTEYLHCQAPTTPPEEVHEMINEAIGLVKPSKWKCIPSSFRDEDIATRDIYIHAPSDIGNGEATLHVEVELKCKKKPYYVKYKWPNGKTTYGWFPGVGQGERILVKHSGLLRPVRVQKAKNQLLDEYNQALENINKILVGDQRYILWEYSKPDDRGGGLLLFHDGTVFTFGPPVWSNLPNPNYLPQMTVFENWLIGKIKSTNQS